MEFYGPITYERCLELKARLDRLRLERECAYTDQEYRIWDNLVYVTKATLDVVYYKLLTRGEWE
jgi:hypothetical protein